MSLEQAGTLMIYLAFPAINLFPILYDFANRWWESWPGRALVCAKTGLALIIDVSVGYHLNGDSPFPGMWGIRLVATVLICAGAWLWLFAYIHARWLQPRQDTPKAEVLDVEGHSL